MKINNALGTQYSVDYYDCDSEILNHRENLRSIMLDAARKGGATIVTDVFHQFNPFGMSGVIVIAESHIAIHTWPEHRVASIDIFSCSNKMNIELILTLIQAQLGAQRMIRNELVRGSELR